MTGSKVLYCFDYAALKSQARKRIIFTNESVKIGGIYRAATGLAGPG